MNESQIKTIKDIERFLLGVTSTSISLEEDKQDVYNWIERTLVRLRYLWFGKKDKGFVLRYMEHLTDYTRQHLGKQYRKAGHIRHQRRCISQGFTTKYTREDIQRLAALDQIVDDLSGTTVKTFCQREFEVFAKQQFSRLAGISVSHIYNLRKSKTYQRCRRTFSKTTSTSVNIEERCKPVSNGKPGYLRVDSVHQGDLDGKKGVYHINAVDKVNDVIQRECPGA